MLSQLSPTKVRSTRPIEAEVGSEASQAIEQMEPSPFIKLDRLATKEVNIELPIWKTTFLFAPRSHRLSIRTFNGGGPIYTVQQVGEEDITVLCSRLQHTIAGKMPASTRASTTRRLPRLNSTDLTALERSGSLAVSRISTVAVTVPEGTDYSHAIYKMPHRILLIPQKTCPQPDLAVSLATSLALTFGEAHDRRTLAYWATDAESDTELAIQRDAGLSALFRQTFRALNGYTSVHPRVNQLIASHRGVKVHADWVSTSEVTVSVWNPLPRLQATIKFTNVEEPRGSVVIPGIPATKDLKSTWSDYVIAK